MQAYTELGDVATNAGPFVPGKFRGCLEVIQENSGISGDILYVMRGGGAFIRQADNLCVGLSLLM